MEKILEQLDELQETAEGWKALGRDALQTGDFALAEEYFGESVALYPAQLALFESIPPLTFA
jgi:uncharacterized protein HemY